jgi:hypothetical protein
MQVLQTLFYRVYTLTLAFVWLIAIPNLFWPFLNLNISAEHWGWIVPTAYTTLTIITLLSYRHMFSFEGKVLFDQVLFRGYTMVLLGTASAFTYELLSTKGVHSELVWRRVIELCSEKEMGQLNPSLQLDRVLLAMLLLLIGASVTATLGILRAAQLFCDSARACYLPPHSRPKQQFHRLISWIEDSGGISRADRIHLATNPPRSVLEGCAAYCYDFDADYW